MTKYLSSHVASSRHCPPTQLAAAIPASSIATLPINSQILLAKGPIGLLPTDVILDSGATFSIIFNADLLSKTHSCSPVTFDGLNGTLSIDQRGSLQDLCDAYFHEAALANILSFSQVRSLGHHISYDAHKDRFTLHSTNSSGTHVFGRHSNGLYVSNMASSTQLIGHVATVSDNEALHSKRDVIKARNARQF